jgi:hypothetical protein
MSIYYHIHCKVPLGHILLLLDNQNRILYAEVALFPQRGLRIDLPPIFINDKEVRVLARR